MADMVADRDEELVGTVDRVMWKSDDGDFCIARLGDKTGIKGNPPSEGLAKGQTYRFLGRWMEDPKYGRQFQFKAAIQQVPADRDGIVEYLVRYATGIGHVTAHLIFDKYGPDCLNVLKADPERVAADIPRLPIEVAKEVAEELKKLSRLQETHVRLLSLIANKGFGEKAISEAIKRWGIHAPEVIKRDPFKLMTARIYGAGYMRCDNLWHQFGLSPDKMRRQVMAAWDYLRSDMTGSTWHEKTAVIENVKRLITGNARPDRAVAVALRAGLFEQRDIGGKLWIAERNKAEDERYLGEKIFELLQV